MNAKRCGRSRLLVGMALAGSLGVGAQEPVLRPGAAPALPESLAREAAAAMNRGAAYLLGKQNADGSWQNFPAITALACVALRPCQLPERDETRLAAIARGRQYILANVQPDGAICTPDRMYVNYSTAVCLSALAVLGNPADIPVVRKTRQYLVAQQLDEDHATQPVTKDNPNYGGFGYGESTSQGPGRGPGIGVPGRGPGTGGPGPARRTGESAAGGTRRDGPGRSAPGTGAPDPGRGAGTSAGMPPGGPLPRADLSCTQWVLEALYLSDAVDRDAPGKSDVEAREVDLAWQKAVSFLQAVQNLQKTGEGGWVVSEGKDGGFAYLPTGPGESDSMRSYGSMTYAGLKSMLYAKLAPDDARVKAALEWARQHYTVAENPGMEAAGHFYYLLTFAKAHAVWGGANVVTADGVQHDWRRDLVTKLLELQKEEGQWWNDRSGRWQENNPELVTCYALISLGIATGGAK